MCLQKFAGILAVFDPAATLNMITSALAFLPNHVNMPDLTFESQLQHPRMFMTDRRPYGPSVCQWP